MKGTGERLEAFDQNPIGLGCWALGGKHWGGQSERDSIATMEASYEQGIRHFDTAKAYGVSERLVGRFLKDKRETVFLASKVFPSRGPDTIREHLQQSLENLQTDFLDLYYLHYPVARTSIEEQMEVLLQARDEGLVHHIGVSNYTIEDLKRVPDAEFLQVGYNALWRGPELDLLPYCQRASIRVVAYSPLAQGILTGKFTRRPQFAKGDNRPSTVPFRDEIWPEVHQAVESLKRLAGEAKVSLAQLAIQWCLARPGVSGIVAGARNRTQAVENAGSTHSIADPSVLDEMTRITDPVQALWPEMANFFGVSFS